MSDGEIADPQVIPYLLYEDAGAAMNWLVDTFRFAARARDVQADGTVRHGELQLDRAGSSCSALLAGASGAPGYHS